VKRYLPRSRISKPAVSQRFRDTRHATPRARYEFKYNWQWQGNSGSAAKSLTNAFRPRDRSLAWLSTEIFQVFQIKSEIFKLEKEREWKRGTTNNLA